MGDQPSRRLNETDFVDLPPAQRKLIALFDQRLQPAVDKLFRSHMLYNRPQYSNKNRVRGMHDAMRSFRFSVNKYCAPNDPLRVNFYKYGEEFMNTVWGGTRKQQRAVDCLTYIINHIVQWARAHHNFLRQMRGQKPIQFGAPAAKRVAPRGGRAQARAVPGGRAQARAVPGGRAQARAVPGRRMQQQPRHQQQFDGPQMPVYATGPQQPMRVQQPVPRMNGGRAMPRAPARNQLQNVGYY